MYVASVHVLILDFCTLICLSVKKQHTCTVLRLSVYIYLSLGQSQRYELFPHT